MHSYRALIDKRLYLPSDWTDDLVRRKRCDVPPEIIYIADVPNDTRVWLDLPKLEIQKRSR